MRTIMIIGVLAAALGALPANVHASKPSPITVNLHLGDLPTGFTLKTDEQFTNAQVAKSEGMTVAQENARGRLLSNHEVFDRDALVGALGVDSTMILYVSAATARIAYLSGIGKLIGVKGFKAMSFDPVGDLREAWIYNGKNGNVKATVYTVVFHRSRYLANMSIYGFTGTVTPDLLTTLARIVDSRIQKNG